MQANNEVDIKLEHPYDDRKFIGQTKINCGALAASSVVKRVWQNKGIQQHHIIDPFRREPSDSGVVSSFVKADTALIADVMATILIIKPELEMKLSESFNLKTILLTKDYF